MSLQVVLMHHLNHRDQQVQECKHVEHQQQDARALVAFLANYVIEKIVNDEDSTQAVDRKNTGQRY